MKNYTRMNDHPMVDAALTAELEAADIPVLQLPEFLRNSSGDVKTVIIGYLHQWEFRRLWYYWAAREPGIPHEIAMALHATHGTVVRTNGFAGGRSPLEQFGRFGVGVYHVDTADGLKALADTIKAVAAGRG